MGSQPFSPSIAEYTVLACSFDGKRERSLRLTNARFGGQLKNVTYQSNHRAGVAGPEVGKHVLSKIKYASTRAASALISTLHRRLLDRCSFMRQAQTPSKFCLR